MLRVLVLSTLFPDATRPNFGIFVERQTLALAEREDVEVRVVAPIGIPPGRCSTAARYAARALPEQARAGRACRFIVPRFRNFPAPAAASTPARWRDAVTPLLDAIRRDFPST
jgi:teichuronic acid biosynthesis glycosyltransferase TuaC